MNLISVSDQDFNKFVNLDIQVSDLLLLQSLLVDVSLGILPDKHFDDKHHKFYVRFFYYLNNRLGEVLNDKKV